MVKPVLVRLIGGFGLLLCAVAGFFWYVTPKTAAYGAGLFGCAFTLCAGLGLLLVWALVSSVLWLMRKQAATGPHLKMPAGGVRPAYVSTPAGPQRLIPPSAQSVGSTVFPVAGECSHCGANSDLFYCYADRDVFCAMCGAGHTRPPCRVVHVLTPAPVKVPHAEGG